MNKVVRSILLITLCSLTRYANATHVMGAEITYECVDSLKYEVTFKFFRDCRGIAMPSWRVNIRGLDKSISQNMGNLSTSTRTIENVSPFCTQIKGCGSSPNQSNSSKGVEMHTYLITLDFNTTQLKKFVTGGACWIRIETSQNARNASITTGPRGTFYSFADLNLCTAPNNSNNGFKKPIQTFCANQPYRIKPYLEDLVDGDSLSFRFGQPFRGYNSATNYSSPYTYLQPISVYYPTGKSFPHKDPKANPPEGLYMDSLTGELVFTPTNSGEVSVMVLEALEWRKNSQGVYERIGLTRRDLQIEVLNCPVNKPAGILSDSSIKLETENCSLKDTFRIQSVDGDSTSTKFDSLYFEITEIPDGFTAHLVDSNLKHPQLEIVSYLSFEETMQTNWPKKLEFVLWEDNCPHKIPNLFSIEIELESTDTAAPLTFGYYPDINKDSIRKRLVSDTLENYVDGRYIYIKRKYKETHPLIMRTRSTAQTVCVDTGFYESFIVPKPGYTDYEKKHEIFIGSNGFDLDFRGEFVNSSSIGLIKEDGDEKSPKGTPGGGVLFSTKGFEQSYSSDLYGRLELEYPQTTKPRGVILRDGHYELIEDSLVINSSFYLHEPTEILVNRVKGEVVTDLTVFKSPSNELYQGLFTLRNEGYRSIDSIQYEIILDSGWRVYSNPSSLLKRSDDSLFFLGEIPSDTVLQVPFLLKKNSLAQDGDSLRIRGRLLNQLPDSIDLNTSNNSSMCQLKVGEDVSYGNWLKVDNDSLLVPQDSWLTYTIMLDSVSLSGADVVSFYDDISENTIPGTLEFISSYPKVSDYVIKDNSIWAFFDYNQLEAIRKSGLISTPFLKFKVAAQMLIGESTSVKNQASVFINGDTASSNIIVNQSVKPLVPGNIANYKYCSGDTIQWPLKLNYKPNSDNLFIVSFQGFGEDTVALTDGKLQIQLPNFKSTTKSSEVLELELRGTSPPVKSYKTDNEFIEFYSNPKVSIVSLSKICQFQRLNVDMLNQVNRNIEWFVNGKPYRYTSPIQLYPDTTFNLYGIATAYGDCKSTTDTVTIEVNPKPKAVFTKERDLYCGEKNIEFKNSSASEDSISQLIIDWDDNNSTSYTNVSTVSYQYASTGAYRPTFIVKTKNSCTDTATLDIILSDIPRVESLQDEFNCVGNTLSFKSSIDFKTGTKDSIYWIISDSIINKENTKWVFGDTGIHIFSLFAVNTDGCRNDLSGQLYISDYPDSDLTVDTILCNEKTINIQDQSLSNHPLKPVFYYFGDGNVMWTDNPNVSHTYQSTGTYHLVRILENAWQCKTSDTTAIVITKKPESAFKLPKYSCIGDTISLIDGSVIEIDGIVSRKWFVNGQLVGNSDFKIVTDQKRVIKIGLETVSNFGCKDLHEQSTFVSARPDFNMEVDSLICGSKNTKVKISGQSDEDLFISEISWGNGYKTEFDSDSMIEHSYLQYGEYPIKLTAETIFGCTDTISKIVRVTGQPSTYFELRDVWCLNDSFKLKNQSTVDEEDLDLEFEWSVNSNKFVSKDLYLQNPSDGLTIFSLTATTPFGCTSTFTDTSILIQNPLINSVTVDGSSCFEDNHFSFEPDTVGQLNQIQSALWEIGPGRLSGVNAEYQFLSVGQFPVKLIITDIFGCSESWIDTVETAHSLPAEFKLNSNEFCFYDQDFKIVDIDTGRFLNGVKHNWSLGDGRTNNQAIPSLVYSKPDTLSLMHITSISGGCYDTAYQLIALKADPQPKLTTEDVCQGDTSVFVSMNLDPRVNREQWFWEGVYKQDSKPKAEQRFKFNHAGVYTVELVQSINDCNDTAKVEHEVFLKPTASFSHEPINNLGLVLFENKSMNHSRSEWTLGTTEMENNLGFIEYQFPKAADYPVTLIVSTENNCSDTTHSEIRAFEDVEFFIPNAISPNGDGLNDKFTIFDPDLIETFKINLYDRRNHLVYSSNDPYNPLPIQFKESSYMWIIHIVDITGEGHELSGELIIVR